MDRSLAPSRLRDTAHARRLRIQPYDCARRLSAPLRSPPLITNTLTHQASPACTRGALVRIIQSSPVQYSTLHSSTIQNYNTVQLSHVATLFCASWSCSSLAFDVLLGSMVFSDRGAPLLPQASPSMFFWVRWFSLIVELLSSLKPRLRCSSGLGGLLRSWSSSPPSSLAFDVLLGSMVFSDGLDGLLGSMFFWARCSSLRSWW